MKEKLLLSIIFALCSYYSCGSNPNRIAWIEERFANSIINNGIIHNEFLFPVEGFVCIHDKLYIQTYGGELNRIQFKKTDDGYMITNFEYLINLQIWPEWLVEKYSKSQILYNIEGDKITINIKGPFGRTRIFPWLTSTDPHDCISKDHGVGSTDHFSD